MSCPCGNKQKYQECCEPFILGTSSPETAEQLMRSRYSAYTVKAFDYLKNSLALESRKDFDAAATKKWAESTHWKKLSILSTKKGTAQDTKGTVEFCAFFETDGDDLQLHEVAEFRKDKDGHWVYVTGDAHTHPANENVGESHAKAETFVRTQAKVGRNDACPCGSGKKFKKCCGG